jgi:hypothetical protein
MLPLMLMAIRCRMNFATPSKEATLLTQNQKLLATFPD